MSKTIKIDVPATIKFVRSDNARRASGVGSAGIKKGNVPGRMKYKIGGKLNDK